MKKSNELIKKADYSQFFEAYEPRHFSHYFRLEDDGNKWILKSHYYCNFPTVMQNLEGDFFMDASVLFTGKLKVKKSKFSLVINKPNERRYIGSFQDDEKLSTILLIIQSDKQYIELLVSDQPRPEDEYELMEDGDFDLDIAYHRAILERRLLSESKK